MPSSTGPTPTPPSSSSCTSTSSSSCSAPTAAFRSLVSVVYVLVRNCVCVERVRFVNCWMFIARILVPALPPPLLFLRVFCWSMCLLVLLFIFVQASGRTHTRTHPCVNSGVNIFFTVGASGASIFVDCSQNEGFMPFLVTAVQDGRMDSLTIFPFFVLNGRLLPHHCFSFSVAFCPPVPRPA